MATQPRAPFYVPRPAEEQLWSPGPRSNRGIIDLCTTELKWFAAPGQVPTKRWNASYTFDDPSVQNAAPVDSPIIAYLTKQKMFGAGGQAPAKSWNASYTFDDPAVWWQWNNRDQPLLVQAVPSIPVSWRFNFDDPALYWQQPTQRSVGLPFVPAIVDRWRSEIPDDQPWSFKASFDLSLSTVAASTTPFTIRQWLFGYDDSSSWYGKATGAAPIPMLTTGGIVKVKQWRWDNDVAETFWNIPPERSAAIPMLTVGGIVKARQWHWDNDDPSMWSGWTNRDLVNTVTVSVQPNPFLPSFWRFNSDDPPPWRQPSQRSVALPFVPIIVDRWRLDIPDDQPWSLTARYDLSLATAPAQQPLVNHWRLDVSDDQFWSLTAQHNLIVVTPTQAPFVIRWRLDLSDDQAWLSAARRNAALLAIPFFSLPRNLALDDPPTWQWRPSSQFVLFKPPFQIKNGVPLFEDDGVDWIGLHRPRPAVIMVQAPTVLPFPARRWNWVIESIFEWQWRPRNNRFLPYTFVPSTRFATAPAEMRAADAAVELRSADAPAETRNADAPAEIRSADAPEEVRSADAPPET